MNANNYIPTDEHRILFLTVLLGFLLRIISFIAAFINTKPKADQSFGMYDIFQMTEVMSPLYSFIVFFTCIFLVWKITFPTILLSLVITFFLTLFFDWWFIDTQQIVAYVAKVNPNVEFKTFDFILIGGSIYDALTLFISNLILIWQISILYRIFRETRQNKSTFQ